ncbi:hypothetical protein GCM10009677_09280 [Sphaerisporangium rubeum]|uniref:DUF4124 domain-containing protein n=1 Tax=Sphaerisporangium rubeum TaxID=321317 RepID=A0A7X0IJW7_9ACTN|nr:hypothetical protein [Sphaerisporangium rubeum]MBB6476565.1 hypothetical protein [Sphaerisporangium rubeum]
MRKGVRYVISVLAAGALALAGGPPAAYGASTPVKGGHDPGRPANGFARNGPWNTKLPRHVPLAPNSRAVVANIKYDKDNNWQTWAVNTDTYSTPVYQVDRHTPRKRWRFSDCLNLPHLAPVIAGSLAAVPTPPDMITSIGTDAAVTIYQPSTDTYWDFWRAEKDADGNWSACWGGKIEHYSRNPGIFDNPLGATATGLPMGAFTIRIDELRRGYIDHALNIVTVRTRAGCHSWPATRDDGYVEGADIPCEGQRFRLDPAFDVSTLTSPAARTIARAMQEYGLIMTDKGGALVTYAEDPRLEMARNGGVDPYIKLFDPDDLVPDGAEKYYVLSEIPVERLQALPIDYGKPR